MAQSISQEAIIATGLPGATASTRYAGATSSGAPTSGTFAVGDFVVDQSGAVWICTSAGTPGTWAVSGTSPTAQIAGKNKIINGDFGIWQRGTSFNILSGGSQYTADRWYIVQDTSLSAQSISQQTFTPGTAPVAGYEGTYYMRQSFTGTTSNYPGFWQKIENVRTFAGQTVTVSFWARASSNVTGNVNLVQNFGSGGSSSVNNGFPSVNITTSWQRFSVSINMASVSGQTIGSSSYVQAEVLYFNAGTALPSTVDLWGVQIEAGSVATEFTTASGSIQGELALCQRYYYQCALGTNALPAGQAYSSTGAIFAMKLPTTMRATPSLTASGTYAANAVGVGNFTYTGYTQYSVASDNINFSFTGATSSMTAYWPLIAYGGTLAITAEL